MRGSLLHAFVWIKTLCTAGVLPIVEAAVLPLVEAAVSYIQYGPIKSLRSVLLRRSLYGRTVARKPVIGRSKHALPVSIVARDNTL